MPYQSNYDKFPFVPCGDADACAVGWNKIAASLQGAAVACVECYPGVDVKTLEIELASRLKPSKLFRAEDAYKSVEDIRAMLKPLLGDDRVFGQMNSLTLDSWFDKNKLLQLQTKIAEAARNGSVLIVGTGAALLA
ncbi:MAG: mannose-6-phosphate isomerase, partial [Bryocella sp.]